MICRRSRSLRLFCRAFLILVLAIAVSPARAATIVVRSGASNGSLGSINGVTSMYSSWTQPAGTTYSSVSVAATLCSINGLPATATVYLTNSIGMGTTAADQITARTIMTTAPCTGPGATSTTLFTGLTLSQGTYYLVLSNMSSNFSWGLVYGGAAESVGTGVTANNDAFSTTSPPPSYPPADTIFASVSFGGSAHVFLYSVSGAAIPASVPTLSAWALSGTGILLAGSGLFWHPFKKKNQILQIR